MKRKGIWIFQQMEIHCVNMYSCSMHLGIQTHLLCMTASDTAASTQLGFSYSPSICPHHSPLLVVQCEAVWPGPDLHVPEHHMSAAAAHGGRFDAWECGVPVCPEQDSGIQQKMNMLAC